MSHLVIRPVRSGDAARINTIYNTYIVDSHVSFDVDAWSDDVRKAWIDEKTAAGYPVFVAEIDDLVVGAAWAGPWRDKEAYAGSVETTVVFDAEYTGAGTGTVLYAQLLDDLTSLGFHRAYAIIALPNDASVALHRKLGYRDIGVLDEVGFKDGSHISTLLMEKRLD